MSFDGDSTDWPATWSMYRTTTFAGSPGYGDTAGSGGGSGGVAISDTVSEIAAELGGGVVVFLVLAVAVRL
jgi:hypothetical protein